MKKRRLNYRFHNPNTAGTSADYLLKVLIEANTYKVKHAVRQAALRDNKEKQEKYFV